MILRCDLLLFLFLSFVSCKEFTNTGTSVNVDQRYSYWPSLHNGARIMQIRKREAQNQGGVIGQSDGGTVVDTSNKEVIVNSTSNPVVQQSQHAVVPKQDTNVPQQPLYVPLNPGVPVPTVKAPPSLPNKLEESASSEVIASSVPRKPEVAPTKQETVEAVETPYNKEILINQEPKAKKNETTLATDKPINGTLEATPSPLDLNNPGVMKRGIIVFGGFLLLAVAYFIFYRRKSNKNDTSNQDSSAKANNQFRYGVLQSEDQRDNMELSRIPLTMESDEEDDDLEIFDLEQKKKSLSYINLETNDEDIVFDNSRTGKGDDNLLLDIEDGSSDTLINWSGNGSKSIL